MPTPKKQDAAPLVPYTAMYAASILVALTSVGLTGVSAQAENLMLNRQGMAVIVVVMGILNLAAGLLPSVRKPPSTDRVGKD